MTAETEEFDFVTPNILKTYVNIYSHCYFVNYSVSKLAVLQVEGKYVIATSCSIAVNLCLEKPRNKYSLFCFVINSTLKYNEHKLKN